MLKKLCDYLASTFQDYFPDQVLLSKGKISHGLMWIILNPLVLLIVLIIGYISGNFMNTYLALSFVFLRLFSGGKHIKNADLCFIFSISMLLLISYYPTNPDISGILNVLMNCVSLGLVFLYAPNGIEKIHKQDKTEFYARKVISCGIAILVLIVNNSVMTLAIFLQALTLVDKHTSLLYNKDIPK